MERALTLVATGTLTVAMVRSSKGKAVTLPRALNLSTGKESMRQTGFSDASWGKATRGYATSIQSLTNIKFDAIVTAAQAFAKPTRAHIRASDATEVIDVDADNERACLIDNSDLDSDCNVLKIILFTSITNTIFDLSLAGLELLLASGLGYILLNLKLKPAIILNSYMY